MKQELLRKLFEGTCSAEELMRLWSILRRDTSATPAILEEVMEQMEEKGPLDAELSRRIYARIEKRISADSSVGTGNPATTLLRAGLWMRVAAAVTLLLVAIWGVTKLTTPTYVVAQTGFGELSEIVLPDGSIATLNANSQLRYRSTWRAQDTRVVHLHGEAYFKVEKGASSDVKFRVHTDDLVVEVLGTIFNVSSRAKGSSVFLEEGAVKVNLIEKADEVFLQPGEVVHYQTHQEGLSAPLKIDPDLQTSWKSGILLFSSTGLEEILAEMEDIYDLDFEVADSTLRQKKFTCSLPTQDVQMALDMLTRMTGTKVTGEGTKSVLTTEPAKPAD